MLEALSAVALIVMVWLGSTTGQHSPDQDVTAHSGSVTTQVETPHN